MAWPFDPLEQRRDTRQVAAWLEAHRSRLHDAGLLARRDDVFRRSRPSYAVAEPLLAFSSAITRPAWRELARPERAPDVWSRNQTTFRSQVLGPHFEELCRVWTERFASASTLGGTIARVGSGVVADAEQRSAHEVDVAELLRRRRLVGAGVRLFCFSGAGCTSGLAALGRSRSDVVLVDLERLYRGE